MNLDTRKLLPGCIIGGKTPEVASGADEFAPVAEEGVRLEFGLFSAFRNSLAVTNFFTS
jgi:hypothetical protein